MKKRVFPLSLRIEQKKKCLFSPRKNFFVKSRLITSKNLRLYSNTERKRQYTGWVERFMILRLIQFRETTGYIKNIPIPRIHRFNCGSKTTIEKFESYISISNLLDMCIYPKYVQCARIFVFGSILLVKDWAEFNCNSIKRTESNYFSFSLFLFIQSIHCFKLKLDFFPYLTSGS